MPDFAMPHVLRSLTTCDPTPMLRWKSVTRTIEEPSPFAGLKAGGTVLEQLCIVKDYDAAGNVTDVRQEWRAVPTEDAS